MTKTSCEDFADRIVDYVDGELPADEAQTVARHLNECEHCRQMAQTLQRSLGLARILWQDNLAEATAARSDAVRRFRSMGDPPHCSTHLGMVEAWFLMKNRIFRLMNVSSARCFQSIQTRESSSIVKKRRLGRKNGIHSCLQSKRCVEQRGDPPMSSTAVPAVRPTGILPVAAPETHGRDAHATHGQDARATICPHGHTTSLPRRALLYAVAVAASILLATGILVIPVARQGVGDRPLTPEQIERQVARVGMAAELLAATRIVAQCEGTESIVEQQYRYILREYADTPAAESIKANHDLKLGGVQHD